MELKAIIEALIFASPEPITLKALSKLLEHETPEAIVIEGAPGFAMAVQWHPEWNAAADPVSRPLFQALGAAVAARFAS